MYYLPVFSINVFSNIASIICFTNKWVNREKIKISSGKTREFYVENLVGTLLPWKINCLIKPKLVLWFRTLGLISFIHLSICHWPSVPLIFGRSYTSKNVYIYYIYIWNSGIIGRICRSSALYMLYRSYMKNFGTPYGLQ